MAVCLFVVVCTLVKGVFRIWNGIAVSRLGSLIGYDLRMEFYRQVLRLDMANFTESGRGDLMNRCTTDLNSISQGVQRLFGQALLEPLKVAVCFRHRRLDQLAAAAADAPHRARSPATRSIGSAKRSSARTARPCRSFR